MNNPHFQQELELLQELASEFACANPALAPLLDGSNRSDPDVERLLEAMAYQNGMLRHKLSSDFPLLVSKLVQLILPHYLRPIPSTTIMGFTAPPRGGQTLTIPAGTQFLSSPVDGTACRFSTSMDLEIQPLEITDAAFVRHSGRSGEIRLSFKLIDLALCDWQPESVRLFLAGDHAAASELYLLLSRHVTRMVLSSGDGGEHSVIPTSCLRPVGFEEDEVLLPYPQHVFSGYRLLQEYFSTPEKFLFIDLEGWERWQQRGTGTHLTVSFELDRLPSGPLRITRDSFALHAVPAVNLFAHDADPISVDHRADRYLVRPTGSNPAHCQIFSVDGVSGYNRTEHSERTYLPFELFADEVCAEPVYHTQVGESSHAGGYQVYLSLSFPGDLPPADAETLSIRLTCSNGRLPENLRIGDITEPVRLLPDFVTARNITIINPCQVSPLGAGLLQLLTTHLYLNQLPLERVEHLRTLLELYVFPTSRTAARGAANLKRIAGIESLEVTPGEHIVAGIPLWGRDILVRVRQDHFAGSGDLYLFGCILDQFLGRYASLNNFTRLEFSETLRGGICQWPVRLGNQPLR